MTAPGAVPASQRVGYVRVSTPDQSTARQLEGVPLDRTFTEYASGATTDRPELARCLAYVREGDTMVVHSIDRLARNLDDLRALVSGLTERGVTVLFVREGLTFAGGNDPLSKMILSVMGSLAEFERGILLERQREGIATARRNHPERFRGRRPKLTTAQATELCALCAAPGARKAEIARRFGITRETLYSYLRRPAL